MPIVRGSEKHYSKLSARVNIGAFSELFLWFFFELFSRHSEGDAALTERLDGDLDMINYPLEYAGNGSVT